MASIQSGHHDAFAIELPIDMSAVEDARLALLDHLAPFNLDARVINRIEVILEEIVSNVVRHGEGCDLVRVRADHEPGAIRLVFEDNGEAFNPFDADEPEAFTSVEEATLGRQGIPLVKRLSRSFGYDRASGINRVTSVVALA